MYRGPAFSNDYGVDGTWWFKKLFEGNASQGTSYSCPRVDLYRHTQKLGADVFIFLKIFLSFVFWQNLNGSVQRKINLLRLAFVNLHWWEQILLRAWLIWPNVTLSIGMIPFSSRRLSLTAMFSDSMMYTGISRLRITLKSPFPGTWQHAIVL